MNFTLSIIYIFTIMAEVISVFILIARGKQCVETYMFLGCQVSSMLWCISQICIFLAVNQIQIKLAYLIGNIGICFIGTFWINFTLYFKKKENKAVMFVSFMISFLEFAVILTNSFHNLYYQRMDLYEKSYGILFYINKLYVYLCVLIGVVFIIKQQTEVRENTRQKLLLLIGVLFPLCLNMFQHIGLIHTAFEVTPLGFSIACLFIFIAMFKYNFLNINQLAFQELIEDIQDGIIVFSANEMFSYMNSAAAVYTDHRKITSLQNFYQMFSEEQLSNLKDKEEVTFVRNGKYIQIQKILSKDKKNNIVSINFLIKDVDKYYQLMEQAAQLSVLEQKLIVEKERNNIIQKVHDTLGHTLTMVQSLIKLGIYSLEEEEKAEEYLQEARKLSGNCIRELREYINESTSNRRNELVTRCIKQLVDTVRGVVIDVSIIGEDGEKYSYHTETLYLCIRELITNCLKYANASQMQIVIKFCENYVETFVFDDGNGCDNIVYGNGFQGIKQRIKRAGGEFRTNSSLGEGFQAFISLPV